MDLNSASKTILIAPLNWGLGHATRCVPIIRALQENNYIPIIASDGAALALLRKEFPYMKFLELPAYNIEYSTNGAHFKWALLKNLPKIISAIRKERKLINHWISTYEIEGLISDNRIGVYSKKIPTVYITHQLNVLSGATTWISTKLHQHSIKKFSQCWVPDFEQLPNLSGDLGHLQHKDIEVKYIGPLSRFQQKNVEIKYDLLIVLSGPEPQRGLLEQKLKQQLDRYVGKVLFIQGIIEKNQVKMQCNDITYYNFMTSKQLEQAINESHLVLCRSGYTSVMDLAKLGKKAFFIPTPGQFEQEYLATKLQIDKIVPSSTQDSFQIEYLSQINQFTGFPAFDSTVDWRNLFTVFKS